MAQAEQAKEMTAAQRLREHAAKLETKIVDVRCPSGFVYRFKQPSKFASLFIAGKLPQTAGSIAVEEWAKAGLEMGETDSKELTPDQVQLIKSAFEVRDRVLELSYDPKFVIGEAKDPEKEISTDEVPDDDLEYLYKWVAAGGEMSAMLGTFPQGSQPGALASARRKKRRKAAK